MAEMAYDPNSIVMIGAHNVSISSDDNTELNAGQRFVIEILNADDTVAQTVIDDSVPAGVTFYGKGTIQGTVA